VGIFERIHHGRWSYVAGGSARIFRETRSPRKGAWAAQQNATLRDGALCAWILILPISSAQTAVPWVNIVSFGRRSSREKIQFAYFAPPRVRSGSGISRHLRARQGPFYARRSLAAGTKIGPEIGIRRCNLWGVRAAN
jgi:hypothetical protein